MNTNARSNTWFMHQFVLWICKYAGRFDRFQAATLWTVFFYSCCCCCCYTIQSAFSKLLSTISIHKSIIMDWICVIMWQENNILFDTETNQNKTDALELVFKLASGYHMKFHAFGHSILVICEFVSLCCAWFFSSSFHNIFNLLFRFFVVFFSVSIKSMANQEYIDKE